MASDAASASKMTANQCRQQLIKNYDIQFYGAINSATKAKWPSSCRPIFEAIQQLSGFRFDTYQQEPDQQRRPWREQIKQRVVFISEKAEEAMKARKNEAGWRASLEHHILGRFSVEVACTKCRGRLWRSELEVDPSSLRTTSASSLRRRQAERKPCECDRGFGFNAMIEPGISKLFDDTVGEAILYPAEIRAELSKNRKGNIEPDRVFGLKQTSNLERLLLWTDDKRAAVPGQPIGQSLKSCPFRPDGEPLLFPFLILEAKSEKAADAFTDIEMQTAFAIRELLLTQNKLKEAAEESNHWDAGPLVWSLANKGPLWKVSAGYIEGTGERPSIRVSHLWTGDICGSDHALQLLLIVDYIIDWARDRYRNAIICSLRSLAANDSRSLERDSVIGSLADTIQLWPLGHEDGPSHPQPLNMDPLAAFDSQDGVIRDARFVRSKFVSLYITEENLDILMRSQPSEMDAKALANSILDMLERAWRVKGEALDAIESHWTGKDRDALDLSQPDETFFVIATVTAYLANDWEQTRELSYVAVAEKLLSSLANIAGRTSEISEITRETPFIKSDTFCQLRLLRHITTQDMITACVYRACLVTGLPREATTSARWTDGTYWSFIPKEERQNGMSSHSEAICKSNLFSVARELVLQQFTNHTIGRIEPSSSIFRVSSALDDIEHQDFLRERPEAVNAALRCWLKGLPRSGLAGRQVVFVSVEQPAEDMGICLYVLDHTAVTAGLSVQRLVHCGLDFHFHTRKYSGKFRPLRQWGLNDAACKQEDLVAKIPAFFQYLRSKELVVRTDDFHNVEPAAVPKETSDTREEASNTADNVLQSEKSVVPEEGIVPENSDSLEVSKPQDAATEKGASSPSSRMTTSAPARRVTRSQAVVSSAADNTKASPAQIKEQLGNLRVNSSRDESNTGLAPSLSTSAGKRKLLSRGEDRDGESSSAPLRRRISRVQKDQGQERDR